VITRIDVSAVLRRTVCELYSDLVTRPTGVAVRTGIEQLLVSELGRTLTVSDFSHVGLLDFSCADEIVAKLLAGWRAAQAREAYFVLAGVRDAHIEPIEAVLERRGLTVVAHPAQGEPALLGEADSRERAVWSGLLSIGRGCSADVACACGLAEDDAETLLCSLWDRRCIMRGDDEFVALESVMPS
jgi:hypothetical protein